MVDVGSNGRRSDGGVFESTNFHDLYVSNEIGIPDPVQLPKSQKKLPFVFVGDDAFPLRENLMKPYPQSNLTMEQRIFN